MAWYRSSLKSGGADLLSLASGSTQFDLDDATIQTSATSIPDNMFKANANIRDISLASLVTVGQSSFESCPNIRAIDLPSCTTIGEQAFYTCRRSVSVSGTTTFNLPEVVTIGANAFYEFCISNNQMTINLPKCTTLNAGAFRSVNASYGINVLEVDLPAVTTIGNQCFQRGTIGTLKIGENCTSIGQNCFLTCTIGDLYCEATTPPSIGSNNLGSPTITHIYVPSGSVTAYKSANGWSAFESIIEAIPS